MKPWIEEMYRALDTWDTNWIIAHMHEEFVFIDDYDMKTREENIEHLLNEVAEEKITWSRERITICDNKEMCAYSFVRDVDGVPTKDTHVLLKRDGKFWRHTIHRQSLE